MRALFVVSDREAGDVGPRSGAGVSPSTWLASGPGATGDRPRHWRLIWSRLTTLAFAAVVATTMPAHAAPPAPSLSSPANGATITGTSVTLVWTSVGGAGAYSVGLRDQNTQQLVYIPLVTGTSYTASVTPGHTYVWDVASCTSLGGGDNPSNCPNRTANRGFAVQSSAPPAPSLSSPANGATITGTSVTLVWTSVSGAGAYSVGLRDQNTQQFVYIPLVTGTSYAANVTPGHAYVWDVASCVSAGGGDNPSNCPNRTANRGFTVQSSAPPAPSLSSPANGVTITGTSVTLVWTSVSGAGAYSVGLRDQNTQQFVYIPLVTGTSYTVSVTPGHAYVWDVASCISFGGGENTGNCPNRSGNRSFTVSAGAPTAPSPVAPTGGQTVSTLTPTLTWSGGSGFSSLQINISKHPFGSANIVFTSSWLAAGTTSLTLASGYLVAGANYRWDVTACSGGSGTGTCAASGNATFSTQAPSTNSFYLGFPLALPQTHLTAAIISVFDHSMSASYSRDDVVVAYDGEKGERRFGWDGDVGHPGFKNAAGTPFGINGNYTGAADPTFLNYDGHPGIDFRAPKSTPVYATAEGIVRYPNSIPGLSNAATYHTLSIDHENGYITYLLHLDSHPTTGNAVVQEGARVTRGQLVAFSGDAGPTGTPPHLHLEIHYGGVPVDPYGWQGPAGQDPYTALSSDLASRNLWNSSGGAGVSDLEPRNVLTNVSTLAPGATFNANWTLANSGAAAANSTSTTAVRINQSPTSPTGTNLASVATPALAAGASVSQSASLVAPTTPGTYYVWVVANSTGTVTNQSNTANDQQRSPAITVQGGSSSSTARRDFDSDGRSDVLWRHDGGTLVMWLMNGTQLKAVGSQGTVATDWKVVGLGDFDGDGRADVLWRRDGGTLVMWLMNGTQIRIAGSQGTVATDWKVAGIGDFDGDGKADVLWRHDGGTVAMWLMNGTQVRSSGGLGVVPTDWKLVAVGDFDGDRRSDVMWRHTGGTVMTWLMNGMQMRAAGSQGSVPWGWKVAATGDLDGDGRSDVMWRHDAGTVVMWLLNGTQIKAAGSQGVVPTAWKVAGAGDYDGDARTDVMWRNDAGTTVTWLMNGTQIKAAGGQGVVPAGWRFQENATP